ncbi:2-amino-4-hydroxy-6-hydroxymethyldihydropteridine pyrophosphokinase [Frondihabitans sp. 762G35]|uniref:2-amino-4-hydroxy-6- hydroxymethyldihydropteridine diphosphokinase n=1 Tax=Frondihabitans sp. 762G35 TaxID=1446794 RepID=UPI000D217F05|nr:2-amino-4-hydroxy-6-hydroxymethyldihydropteridine diphosphokinase [Frondihabitans sp. 762G35]ARC55599.1 2-amino-4-hydroxy-6-hydroxymethyldihydropteridine pyrophosphokinase [Frondihabitans sp. 762G35]
MSPTVRAVIALGSNLGDRDATLRGAVADIAAIEGVVVVGASVPIESVAVTLAGLDDSKPNYLNGVVVVDTTLEPEPLLRELNRIESEHGRVRLERWGDRTLDLDLIVHGDDVRDTGVLTLPHPRAAERSFVLEPWLQVEPDASLPGGERVADLLGALGDPVAHVPGAEPLDVAPAGRRATTGGAA